MTDESPTAITIRVQGPAAARAALLDALGQHMLPQMSPHFILQNLHGPKPDDVDIRWFQTRLTTEPDVEITRPSGPVGSVWVELHGPGDLAETAERFLRRSFRCGPRELPRIADWSDDIRFEVDPFRSPEN